MNATVECRTTVLIINYNAGPELARTVGSVLNRLSPVKLLIVDNASQDDSLELVAALHGSDIRIIRNKVNRGFGPACNQGAEHCDTEYLLILNSDCELPSGAIRAFEDCMEREHRAGLISGIVVGHDNHEQRGSRRLLPTPERVMGEMLRRPGQGIDLRHLPMPTEAQEVEAVSGACMFLRRSAFLSTGGFDPGYGFHFEDLDLMCRLGKEGWKIILLPQLRIRHIGGLSGRSRPLWVSRNKHRGLVRYLRKHCDANPFLLMSIQLLAWLHFIALVPLLLVGWRKP